MKKNHDVLGYSVKENGLIKSLQSNFLNKGLRKCAKVTFEDGRTIECTDTHRLLSSDNKWLEVKNIELNSTRIKVGVKYPVVDFDKEIEECNNWSLDIGDNILKTDTLSEYLKTLAFCRILGYITFDGTITENVGIVRLGHSIDVETFTKDLKYFQPTVASNLTKRNIYEISIHKKLLRNILNIEGVIVGKKVDKEATLPSFILDINCPKPLVREFLGGMFGADGHTCVLSLHRGKRDQITSIGFSKSRNLKYIKSLVEMMNVIKNLLKIFDINDVNINNLKETTHSKKNYEGDNKCFESNLRIYVNELEKFTNNIGFRYCCHKNMRLCAGLSFHNYKKIDNNYVIAEEYIKNIGALSWFDKYGVKREENSLPTMNLKIIKIEDIGEQEVFDIQVEDTHSFLANGVVAHNCMIAHGVSRFLKERLFEKSDPYTINICDDCGNIATSQTECKFCNGDKISRVGIPYASKLLILELMAMQIKVKFSVKA